MSDGPLPVYLHARKIKAISRRGEEKVSGTFWLKRKQSRPAKKGTYWSLDLADVTGAFHLFCFPDNPLHEVVADVDEGKAVLVEMLTTRYQGKFSPRLLQFRELTGEELNRPGMTAWLVRSPEESMEVLRERLENLISAIEPRELQDTVRVALEAEGQGFMDKPAAYMLHHAYRGGLLEHSLQVATQSRALLPFYPQCHEGLVIAGALLHDIGKVADFQGHLQWDKTERWVSHGHVAEGFARVRAACTRTGLDSHLAQRLEHIILSHQGEREWGAAMPPATLEALLVAQVDQLNARLTMAIEAIGQRDPEKPFTDPVPGLNNHILVESWYEQEEES